MAVRLINSSSRCGGRLYFPSILRFRVLFCCVDKLQALFLSWLWRQSRETQIIVGLGPRGTKRFMHHYNFPQYHRETGRYGAPWSSLANSRCSWQYDDALVCHGRIPHAIHLVALENTGDKRFFISSIYHALPLYGWCGHCQSKAPVNLSIAMNSLSNGNIYVLTDIKVEDHFGMYGL